VDPEEALFHIVRPMSTVWNALSLKRRVIRPLAVRR
jgi:hypothetical protein